MHAIQTLFSKVNCCLHRDIFKEAYDAFEQCTLIMPTLSAAWENMAVCLANQGLSKSEIQSTILLKAPKTTHDSIVAKIHTLIISERSTTPTNTMTYLQVSSTRTVKKRG